jgi:predicted 3-demethylubiquinone-9 3-methyltransferase (glyoxalase superfamily)
MTTDTRKEIVMSKVAPHLWFAKDAEEAANFYVSLLPDSRMDSVTTMPADSPSGPPGSVQMVEFTLAGQQFLALAAGPLDPFNHAISFVINCDDQAVADCGARCRKVARSSSVAGSRTATAR